MISDPSKAGSFQEACTIRMKDLQMGVGFQEVQSLFSQHLKGKQRTFQ